MCESVNRFLTTEELVSTLNQVKDEVIIEKKKFKLNKKHVFWSIVILTVLHLVFMGLPLMLKDNTTDVLGYQYVVAFGRDQEIPNQLVGKVVRLNPVDPNEIEIGDSVLIYKVYDYGDYYWDLEVIDVDDNAKTIKATFDGNIKNTYTFDQVEGEIGKPTNIIGTFYYTASTTRGFIIMIFFHAVIIYGAYYLLIQSNKTKKNKELAHEEKS